MLSSQEQLDAALYFAREAFKRRSLKPVDIQLAVKKARKKAYAERQKESKPPLTRAFQYPLLPKEE